MVVDGMDYSPRSGLGVLIFNTGNKKGICVTVDTVTQTDENGKCMPRPKFGVTVEQDNGIGICMKEAKEDTIDVGAYRQPTASYKTEQEGYNLKTETVK